MFRKFFLMCLVTYFCFAEEVESFEFKGAHFMASYYGCNQERLNDREGLLEILTEAIKSSGATLLKFVDYQFEPQGLTIVALLSESHASIHTYPEHGACFVDLFTCGMNCHYEEFNRLLETRLEAKTSNVLNLVRE